MKKLINLLTILVMVSVNVFTPFSYAGVETGAVVDLEEPVIEQPVIEEPINEIPEENKDDNASISGNVLDIEEHEEPINPIDVIEPELPIEPEAGSGNVVSMSGLNNDIEDEHGTTELSGGNNIEGEKVEENNYNTGYISKLNNLEKEHTLNLLHSLTSEEIRGEGSYAGVKVEVYAQTGAFPSGTILSIIPITGDNDIIDIQDVLKEQKDIERTEKLIAFDISFLDKETKEELQPSTGTVQVTFNYEDNEELKQAEEDETQEVKVYHLNDKDEEGEKIEEMKDVVVEEVVINEEESEEGVMVVEAESFSVYTIVVQVSNEGIDPNYQLENFEYGKISIKKPSSVTNSLLPDGFTIMDRNLGAIMTGAGALANPKSYGYHYQWGNNYGFDSNKTEKEINIKTGSSENVNGAKEYYSPIFRAGSSSWMYKVNDNLWSGEYKHGPCPEGWHIPTREEWDRLLLYYNQTYISSGTAGFINYFKIPFAGTRSYSNAILSDTGNISKFWSSTPYSQYSEYDFKVNPTQINLNDYTSRSAGLSVRCFADVYESIDVPQFHITYDYDGGMGSTSTINVISGGKLEKPSNPIKEGYNFLGWYLTGSKIFDFENTQITGDIKLYAKRKSLSGTAMFIPGKEFNVTVKSLSRPGTTPTYEDSNGYIRKIKRASSLTTKYTTTGISVNEPGFLPIYAWFDDDESTIYYFTEAEIIYLNIDSSYMFNYLYLLDNIDMYGRKVDNVENMSHMFSNCRNLVNLNINDWKTSNVVDMNYMFSRCEKLEALELNNREVSNVSDMKFMFEGCYKLKTLNIGKWNTSSVTDMNNMFANTSLKTLDISGRNTSKVRSMAYMFINSSIESINMHDCDVGNVKSMDGMFQNCQKLKNFIIGHWDTSNVTSMSNMFYNCKSLESLDLGSRDTSNVYEMGQMFYGCTNLETLDASNWNTSSLASTWNMFYNCSNLNKIYVGGKFRTSNISSSSDMFKGATSLVGGSGTIYNSSYIDKTYARVDKGSEKPGYFTLKGDIDKNVAYLMPGNSFNITIKNLANNVSSMGLYSSDNLIEKIKRADTLTTKYLTRIVSAVDSEVPIYAWFDNSDNTIYYYSDVDTIEINGNGSYMFSNLSGLKELDINNLDTSHLADASYMFYNDTRLKTLDLSNINVSRVRYMYNMFERCTSLENLDTTNWNTKNLINISYMFYNCSSIKTLDLSSWNTSRLYNINSLFYNANNLETIYVSNLFTNSNIGDSSYTSSNTFNGTTSIVGGNGTTYDVNHIDAEYARIDTPEISGYFTNILDKPYKITYNSDGGSIVGEKTTYTQRDTFTLPTPTKQGYVFKGWIGSNGNNPQVEVKIEAGTVKGDLEYTAVWELDSGSHSSGGGGKRSEPSTSEVTNDTTQEHNSADDKTTKPTSDTTTASLNEETKKEVVSVTKEVSDDGTEVEVVVEAVAIKNTNIVATVRTETPVNGTTSSTYSSSAHTQEQADAYSFAKANGITTTESIETAKMNTELTRIQMAKMLSNFAINVLGEEPDVSKGTVNFDDVNDKMNEQYDNAVTKAYQLGIMGQNVKDNEFRPNDGVTRAEFSASLSRLLYKTDEGEYKGTSKYYVPHIVKLYNEGIVNKADPKIKEKRGYVMTMLKRTVE